MATIANPPPGFDFPLYADFSTTQSFGPDALTHFLSPHDDGSADAGSGVSDARDMAYTDPEAFSRLFTSDAEHQQQHATARTTNAPHNIYQPSLHPPIPNAFGQLVSAVSSSSETVNSIQSSTSSNTGSPGMHGFAVGQQFTGYMPNASSAEAGSVGASSFDPDAFDFDYQNLLAGDRAFGYVGESQDFSSSLHQPPPPYQLQSHPQLPSALYAGVLQDFSLPSSSSSQVDASLFKKPHAAAPRAQSVSSSSPASPSGTSPSQPQGYWQNPWESRVFQRAGSTDSFVSPALPSVSPSSVQSPRFASAAPVRRDSRVQQDSSVHVPSKEEQFVAFSEQEHPESFFYSPHSLQNTFFNQSSGNYVPPLDISYPSLLQPVAPTPPSNPTPTYHGPQGVAHGSPTPSHTSSVGPTRRIPRSPYLHSQGQGPWMPYPVQSPRRSGSDPPRHGSSRSGSADFEDRERERSRCPECGKPFRDLKAHMLTHQNERPEKCPITSCEYHKKGFSRKYDKNRHTLTHYKGTMVCGFCPHSGSAAEKSFNRADVFKRHLMTVHGVEQNPPNSRKKPSTASRPGYGSDSTGKCSICQSVFASAQDFYEHLEDCVLDVVQKVDPSEAINERLLTSVADDEDVKATLERATVSTSIDITGDEDEDDDDEPDEDAPTSSKDPRAGRGSIKSKKDDPS